MPEIIGGFNDVDLKSSKTKLQEALNINNGTEEDNTVINNVVQSPDSMIRKYGILQDVVIQSSDEDIFVKAQSVLNDHNLPEETVSVTILCSIDEIFDYKVGYGIHLLFPYYKQYEDCFMYIKDVSSKFYADGKFSCTLTLTPSRVMDEIEWDTNEEQSNGDEQYTTSLANKIIAYARQFLGVPYVWGGTTPSGFDCSGLTQYVFNNFTVEEGLLTHLERVTTVQCLQGKNIDKNNESKWQVADLIFFGVGKQDSPHHVGILSKCENGQWYYIHAPQTGDVVKEVPMTRNDIHSVRRLINEEANKINNSGVSISSTSSVGLGLYTENLVNYIKVCEGFKGSSYSSDGGKSWIIGYGFTYAYNKAIYNNGASNSTITEQQADVYLRKLLSQVGKQVQDYCNSKGCILMPNVRDALIDYCYLLGFDSAKPILNAVISNSTQSTKYDIKQDIKQVALNCASAYGSVYNARVSSTYNILKNGTYKPYNS